MKLKPLSPEQTAQVYHTLLTEAFPPAELKSLAAMEEMQAKGTYIPYGFFIEEEIVGACFLWIGKEGVALIDHLCVSPLRRNEKLGEQILLQIQQLYPTWVILAESEYPPLAPDAALAQRRLGFYKRNHAKLAPFRGRVFGVVYNIFYWGQCLTVEQYRCIYEQSFSQEKMERYVRIPDTSTVPEPIVDWQQ